MFLASLAPLPARGDAVDRLKPDYLKALHAAIEGLKQDRQAISLPSKFTDYRGAMHVHSGLSHDSRSQLSEVIAGAKKAGMRFLMFTEHPVPHHDYFKEGHHGLVDGVLLIPGAELTGLLAFPMSSVPEGSTDPQAEVDAVLKTHGQIFLCHLEERMDWDLKRLTGSEIYNLHADFKDETRLIKSMRGLTGLLSLLPASRKYPQETMASLMDYPADYLRRYDQLCEKSRLTGIAANDAHHNNSIKGIMLDDGRLQLVDALGTKLAKIDSKVVAALKPYVPDNLHPGETAVLLDLDPYERSFHHVSTHLFLPELSERAVRDALTAGRAFVSFEWIADPTGFNFQAVRGAGRLRDGERGAFRQGAVGPFGLAAAGPLSADSQRQRGPQRARPFLFASARIARQLSLGSLAQFGRNARGLDPLQPDLRPRLTSGSLKVRMMRQVLQIPKVASQSRRTRGICASRRPDLLRRASSSEQAAVGPTSPPVRPSSFSRRKSGRSWSKNASAATAAQLQKGGLRLDSRESLLKGGESGPVVNPGHPEKSELVRAINYEADGFQMPPTGKLDADSIGALTEWIREGAAWPASSSGGGGPSATRMDFAKRAEHWSFQPLRRSVVPRVAEAAWPRNPVDAFLAQRQQAAGCGHADPADRRTLLRRVTFDLIGLPPTIDEINAFLADDSPRAYEKVVDRLLASPHYGVRWARHWLDLVRFAETYGHEFDYPIPEAWRYRDYLVRAFNDDLPFNQFVTEHIAGDLIPRPRRNVRDRTNESVVATAFWWFGQAVHSPVDLRVEECNQLDNQVDVMGKAFLGLSIACARCHDHKFDPIRARDYYALTGFLRSSRQQFAFLADPQPVTQFANWRRSCEPRCTELVARLLNPQRWSDGSPNDEILRPWRELKELASGPAFVARRQQLAEEYKRVAHAAATDEQKSVVFEDFSSASFAGWRSSGSAFVSRPTRAGDFVLGTSIEQPILEFAAPGAAHSGLIAPRLRGALRSKTFTITKPFIQYHAERRGATDAAARPYKAGQLNVIVDGFQIIRDPLWGQLSLNVENDAPAAWYTQNVSKLIGSQAYLEIVDEDDGWIAVDAIRFSDDARPPVDRPNDLVLSLLDDPAIDGPAEAGGWLLQDLSRDGLALVVGTTGGRPFREVASCLAQFALLALRTADRPREAHELARLLDEIRRREATLDRSPRVLALADGSGENDHVLIRGNPRKAGEEVSRRFLEVFHGAEMPAAEAGSGRLELAQSLTGSAAPLVARVIVNRLWHHHFGRGLVASTDDFGKMGEPPTHPELLDYLARELIRSGWSIKRLQRLLVTSAAYRLSSHAADPRSDAVDPENRLVHKARVTRLEGEAIRDSILAVSGRLDERLEGPSVPVHLDDFMTGRGRPGVSGPLDGGGRRSIYLEVRRNFLNPMFLAFDFPIPATAAGRRAQSNVPAQALTLLNDPFVAQQARLWARGVLAGRLDQAEDARLDRLYETAFARRPTSAESALSPSSFCSNRVRTGRVQSRRRRTNGRGPNSATCC